MYLILHVIYIKYHNSKPSSSKYFQITGDSFKEEQERAMPGIDKPSHKTSTVEL